MAGMAGLAATASFLLLAVTATAVWAAFQADARARAEADARNELAFNLYLRNIPRAREEAILGNWGEADVLLDAIDRDCPERLRGWEYDLLRRLPDAPLRETTARVGRGVGTNLDLVFSPDGRLLAGPGPDPEHAVTIWDLVTGRQWSSRGGRSDQVLCVGFRPPDGGLLASSGRDGEVRFWNPATGEPVGEPWTAHGGKSVDGMEFSPDGRLLATVGADEWVRVWDVATRTLRHEFAAVYKKQARMVRRVAFSPDGRLFAYGGVGNAVKVWDMAADREAFSLEGHDDLVYAVEFSPRGDQLVSTSWDLTAKVWDLTASGGRERFHVDHSSAAWSVAFSPDGSLLAVAGGIADPTVKVYDARTGGLLHTLGGHAERVGCVAFHPGGRRLASCSQDQTVRIWELDRGKEVLTLRGHQDLVTRVVFDPKGWWLASSGDDGTLRVWDGIPPGEGPGRPCVTLRGHTHKVFGLAFSPDGQQLASASQDRTVRVWDVAAGREIHALKGHTDTVFAVAFGPDGLLVSGSFDRTMRIWDARTGSPGEVLHGREVRARGLALSNDAKRLLADSFYPPYQVWLWDVRQDEPGFHLERRLPLESHNGPAFGIAFSPDGRSVASAGVDGKVIVSDTATGRKRVPLTRPGSRERGWAVAFRPPHGRQLAAGYSGGLALTWDLDTGEGHALTGHTKDVYGVAYSPDGRWLATATWSEVIIREASTGKPVRKIDGYRGLIWALAWAPDRPVLAVAGGREGMGDIELWDVSDLPARATAGAGQ
jgi:WD40 repeat protein